MKGLLDSKKLNIAMGVEARYHTPYKADDYSPLIGSFFYQNRETISNLPDVNAFVHFRILSFKSYFRLENLNTVRTFGGLQFNNNNLSAPNTPGLDVPPDAPNFVVFRGYDLSLSISILKKNSLPNRRLFIM